MCLCVFAELTHSECIVQFEAAEDLVNISGMQKPVASHHHLETLWDQNKKRAGTIRTYEQYAHSRITNLRHLFSAVCERCKRSKSKRKFLVCHYGDCWQPFPSSDVLNLAAETCACLITACLYLCACACMCGTAIISSDGGGANAKSAAIHKYVLCSSQKVRAYVCVCVCVSLTFSFPRALLKRTDRGLPAYAAVSMWLLPSIC